MTAEKAGLDAVIANAHNRKRLDSTTHRVFMKASFYVCAQSVPGERILPNMDYGLGKCILCKGRQDSEAFTVQIVSFTAKPAEVPVGEDVRTPQSRSGGACQETMGHVSLPLKPSSPNRLMKFSCESLTPLYRIHQNLSTGISLKSVCVS